MEKKDKKIKDTKIAQRIGKFTIVGISLALFNYLFYTFLALVVIENNELLWLSSLISTAITTILAYLLHSKITWQERTPTRIGIINFFIWNALLTIIICPFLTWLFGFITPLYEFAFNISKTIHLPFNYDFIESTCIFILVNIVVMILNYFFYDKLVFGKEKHEKS